MFQVIVGWVITNYGTTSVLIGTAFTTIVSIVLIYYIAIESQEKIVLSIKSN